MAHKIIEKEFESNGLKCVITFNNMGFRCGYIGVPETHLLYGKRMDDYLEINKEDIGNREVSNVFALIGAIIDDDDRVTIGTYFNCHGGITYSNGGKNSTHPIESDLWWFGFDCGHFQDGKELELAFRIFPEYRQSIAVQIELEKTFPTFNKNDIRTLEYVENECIKLAEQLSQFSNN